MWVDCWGTVVVSITRDQNDGFGFLAVPRYSRAMCVMISSLTMLPNGLQRLFVGCVKRNSLILLPAINVNRILLVRKRVGFGKVERGRGIDPRCRGMISTSTEDSVKLYQIRHKAPNKACIMKLFVSG